ncbi:MAG: hypothetical protein ACYDEV_17460 [Acidiferrobacter sp.]
MDKNLSYAGPWIKGAYALTATNLLLWTGITVLYLALVALVSRLPFVGGVLVVLFTPAIIAGIFKEASNPRPTQSAFARMREIFIGALQDRELALPVMSAATILLGAWVFLSVLAMLFGVDGFSLARLFAYRTPVASVFTALLLVIFWALQAGLVMTVLYVLADIVLGAFKPVDALEHTLGLWRTRPLAISVLGGVFVLPLILASYFPPWVRALVALATLVPLTLAIYVSYGVLGSRSTSRL